VRAVFFPSVHPVPFKLRPEAALGRTQKALVAAQKAARAHIYKLFRISRNVSVLGRPCMCFSLLATRSIFFLLFALGSARRLNLAVIRRVGGCSATLAVCRLVGGTHCVDAPDHLSPSLFADDQHSGPGDPPYAPVPGKSPGAPFNYPAFTFPGPQVRLLCTPVTSMPVIGTFLFIFFLPAPAVGNPDRMRY
jgi:hypothetical protein